MINPYLDIMTMPGDHVSRHIILKSHDCFISKTTKIMFKTFLAKEITSLERSRPERLAPRNLTF